MKRTEIKDTSPGSLGKYQWDKSITVREQGRINSWKDAHQAVRAHTASKGVDPKDIVDIWKGLADDKIEQHPSPSEDRQRGP